MISNISKGLRTVLIFAVLSLVAFGFASYLNAQDLGLAPVGGTTEAQVSVWKCTQNLATRVTTCEKIAGEPGDPLPLQSLSYFSQQLESGTLLLVGESYTEVNSHGASANCRIVGVGGSGATRYVLIVCG